MSLTFKYRSLRPENISQSAMSVAWPVIGLLLIFFFFSCKDTSSSTNSSSKKKYGIYILAKDGKRYMLETNVLDSGIIYPEKEGVELTKQELYRDIIVKDGFYYRISNRKNTFSKYKIAGPALNTIASVPLEDFAVDNFYWLNKDTLLLVGLNARNSTQAKYALIQTRDMKVLVVGSLAIPPPSGKYTSISTGFAELNAHKLLIGYTYNQQLSAYQYTTSDTMYLASFSYPEMKKLETEKDIRSTYPGGTNLVQPFTFYDEKGNYYFMTCPGIALGNRADLPTGIFRIKAGETTLDKTYFFNITTSVIQNHGYGMWYLGGNQAIIRTERKDLFKGVNDHYSTAHFEFYLIDLSGKVLKKLALPLDKGTRRACILVKGNTAYIAVNSTKEGNYIWMYDLKTGTLKKGLQLAGDTDFIMRIDELYP